MNIQDAINELQNAIIETEFEGEFVSIKAKIDREGNVAVETETVAPDEPFVIRTDKKDEIVRRRFSKSSAGLIDIQVWESGNREWIPENEADWVTA
jgi:hypothetical protein